MDKLRLLICDTLVREVRQVVESEGYGRVEVAAYPALCGSNASASEALHRQVQAAEQRSGRTCLMGCCAVDRVDRNGDGEIELATTARCFDLLLDSRVVDALVGEGCHLVTPGWLSGWRERLSAWGFDQEMAREFYGAAAEKIMLLDTHIEPNGHDALREFADYVGLPAERMNVTLDEVRLFVARLVQHWEYESLRAQWAQACRDDEARQRDHQQVADLLGGLTSLRTEHEVTDRIARAFAAACGPQRLLVVPFRDGAACPEQARPEPLVDLELATRIAELQGDHALSETDSSFLVRLRREDRTLAVVSVEGVACGDPTDRCLKLCLSLAPMCALALEIARANAPLAEVLVELEQALEQEAALARAQRAGEPGLPD